MEQGSGTTTTSNGVSMYYNIVPTKKEILQRLLKEEHITFDEMWVLMKDEEVGSKYFTTPFPIITPNTSNPLLPPWTTCSTNKKQDDNQ